MGVVAVVDYGMGNLLSVERALLSCGADVELASTPEAVEQAEILVLPGVGAFADGMAGLRSRSLVEPLRAHAASGRPLLAICLGMHMLFDRGTEFGDHEGLGILPGSVDRLPRIDANGASMKRPHIGWSPLVPAGADWSDTALADTGPDDWFYFVHSFAGMPGNDAHRLADAMYGGVAFPAVVATDNVVGVQFHPEKSGRAGLRLIATFLAAAGGITTKRREVSAQATSAGRTPRD